MKEAGIYKLKIRYTDVLTAFSNI